MISLLTTVILSATLAPRPAEPAGAGAGGGPSLHWTERSGQTVVEVVGLAIGLDVSRGSKILAVRVRRPSGGPAALPIVGRYEVEGTTLRFSPRYPLLPGTQYIARLDLQTLSESAGPRLALESSFTPPPHGLGPSTEISAVYPTAGILPENQLKLYIQFSGPMSRGEAYRRVRLLDLVGHPVERPFLEIGEELWDPAGTRLTLLFDPGRIKRGLLPRREEGPILQEGRSYTLVIDADWRDADDRPLRAGFRKPFRAGPPDDAQPLPRRWTFEAPPPGSRGPLVVLFPEPLDRAMLGRAIVVKGSHGVISGRVEIGHEETSWRFTPEAPWGDGPIGLVVDAGLEDLAGNSIARPFEVGVASGPASGPTPATVSIPVRGPR